MTYQDALGAIDPGKRRIRYRWLCSDANPDVAQRDAYRASAIRKATGDPVPPSLLTRAAPAAGHWSLIRKMHACPYRSVNPPCGCAGAWCSLKEDLSGRRPAVVGHRDCFECLTKYPEIPMDT